MQLELRNLSKVYRSPRGAVDALQDVNLQIQQGEFVALVGPSGCGKSTLLRLIAGLLKPAPGALNFLGWTRAPKRRLVFQDHGLFPWMPIWENVAFGLEMDGV
ncbi:MAG: ATP-binding cassette domain-containing protein, partial [Litorilinea sp.]